jgi:hypothetical protein
MVFMARSGHALVAFGIVRREFAAGEAVGTRVPATVPAGDGVPKTTLMACVALTSLPANLAASEEIHGKFACNLHALTPERRAIHGALTERLFGAVEQRREIPAGYELRVDARKMSIVGLATWIDDERKCCPFLGLGLEKEPDDGPLWLRLTGPEGVKEFLRTEMGEISGSGGRR